MPRSARRRAALKPVGPPPTMITSWLSIEAPLGDVGDMGRTIEALAAAHHGAGAALQAAHVTGGQRPFEGGRNFTARDMLAMADNFARPS